MNLIYVWKIIRIIFLSVKPINICDIHGSFFICITDLAYMWLCVILTKSNLWITSLLWNAWWERSLTIIGNIIIVKDNHFYWTIKFLLCQISNYGLVCTNLLLIVLSFIWWVLLVLADEGNIKENGSKSFYKQRGIQSTWSIKIKHYRLAIL